MGDLPGQVDGALLRDAAALRRLRAAWGDALIVVRGGNLEKADLRGARLHNICFLETKFAGSDWRGARANGIGFSSSDLAGADLRQASMPGVLFDGPFLDRVDASGADFSGGRMTGNDFGGWDGLKLDRASLRDFRFDCRPVSGEQCVANWGKVRFGGADLGGAAVDGHWGDADWTGARLAGTRINLRQLPKLHGARIAGDLLVHEQPATVRLSPADYRALAPQIAERRDHAPRGAWTRGRPGWLRPGADVLFVAAAIDFSPAARRSPVFQKLLPAIVAGAISYVRVEVDARGRLSAFGSAVGGNQHLCSIGAKGLRLGKDGWYSGVAPAFGDADKPTGVPVPVIRFSGERAEVYERGHPNDAAALRNGYDMFVMCGARAGFEEMIRVPLAPGEAHRLWHEAGMDPD